MRANASDDLPTCLQVPAAQPLSLAFALSKLLLVLPLYLPVVLLGLRRPPGPTVNHSDCFTFHMLAIEALSAAGAGLLCWALHAGHWSTGYLMGLAFVLSFPGQLLFHCLTCGERYLAVAYPLSYLRLRQRRAGVRLQRVTGLTWPLLSGCILWIYHRSLELSVMVLLCFLVLSISVVSFCSVSVLWALGRDGAARFKQRAFCTITLILGTIVLWFGFVLGGSLLLMFQVVTDTCLVSLVGYFLSLPSSLVLPLLFLQRAGKIPRLSQRSR